MQELCNQLFEMSHRLGPDAKLPTVVQLCEQLDVSMSTLNTALKELEEHNILERRHGVGVFVSPSLHRRFVSLVCDSLMLERMDASAFWIRLLERARHRAEEGNESFDVHVAMPMGHLNEPLQRGLSREIRSGMVDAIIGIGLQQDAADWIEAQGVPFVALFGPGSHVVGVDNGALWRLGVRELQRLGCTRIGIWNGLPPKRPTWPDDCMEEWIFRGVKEEFAAFGLEYRSGWHRTGLELIDAPGGSTDLSFSEQGFRVAREVFSAGRASWPDGLVLTNDEVTRGAIQALLQLGVRPGQDVEIATHYNRGLTTFLGFDGQLTRLEVDPDELVQEVFATLDQAINGTIASTTVQEFLPRVRPASGREQSTTEDSPRMPARSS